MLGQLHDSDIKLLRVFRVIAKHGGFSAAQAELNTSQATISTQIKQLETRIGRRLCQRGKSGFQLTEAGEVVLEASERLFASIDEFRNQVLESFQELRGDLRLGVLDSLVQHPEWKLPECINLFGEQAPNVAIKISIHSPRRLESKVLDGSLQLAIGVFHHRLPALDYQALFQEPHQLYCGTAHPLFDKASSKIPDRQLEQCRYFGWGYLESSAEFRHPLFISAESGGAEVEAAAYAVLSGRYIAYLPEHYADQWVSQNRMKAINTRQFRRSLPILLITRKAGQQPYLAELFTDTLLSLYHAKSI